MNEKRETRFCFCGWSIVGTEAERRAEFLTHRGSDDHRQRTEKAISNIDGLVEVDILRRLGQ